MNRVRFAVAGGALAGLDNGLVPATRIALLVPGYTGSKEDFQPLLRPLAAAGIRAVAIDQRGQYESSWAPTAEGYRVEALAEDVLAVADQLRVGPGRLHLLGHSFGGLVTRAATLAQPELFHDLVLMGSGPAAIGGQRREMIEAGEPVLSTGGMPALWEHLQRRAQADPRYLRPAPNLLAFLEQRFLATDPVGLRVMGQALRSEPDRVGELAADPDPARPRRRRLAAPGTGRHGRTAGRPARGHCRGRAFSGGRESTGHDRRPDPVLAFSSSVIG